MSCSLANTMRMAIDEIRSLRAQLAAVTKERDALRADNADLLAAADAYELMLTQVGRERDAIRARVAALEAALALDSDLTVSRADRELVLQLRARAGLGEKEGG